MVQSLLYRVHHLCRAQYWLIALSSTLLLLGCTTVQNPIQSPLPSLQNIPQAAKHSGFVLLESGLDAFAVRTELFRTAQKSIDVQYYLVRNDLTGHLFYQSLYEAANRGVKVRILLDDQYLRSREDRLLFLSKHPNIKVKSFNPYSRRAPRIVEYIFRLGKATRRMHNKAVIVDKQWAIVGSRNIGNEYSQAASKRVYSGMEVLAKGAIAKDILHSFNIFWQFRKTIPIKHLVPSADFDWQAEVLRYRKDPKTRQYTHALQHSSLVHDMRKGTLSFQWAAARVVADKPEKVLQRRPAKGRYLAATGLGEYLNKTSREVILITPYFIPGQEGLKFFRQLRDKGIKISVLTNSYASTDVKIVNSRYRLYRKALLKMGVKLYEFKSFDSRVNWFNQAQRWMSPPPKAGLHAKIFIFDRRYTYVGSMNVDPRSIYENTEMGITIDSSRIGKKMVAWLDKNLDTLAYHVKLHRGSVIWQDFAKSGKVLTKEPDIAPSERVLMKLQGLLPVESQL